MSNTTIREWVGLYSTLHCQWTSWTLSNARNESTFSCNLRFLFLGTCATRQKLILRFYGWYELKKNQHCQWEGRRVDSRKIFQEVYSTSEWKCPFMLQPFYNRNFVVCVLCDTLRNMSGLSSTDFCWIIRCTYIALCVYIHIYIYIYTEKYSRR